MTVARPRERKLPNDSGRAEARIQASCLPDGLLPCCQPTPGDGWFMGAVVLLLENLVEGLSPWGGAVRWGLFLSSQSHPLFLSCCFPQRCLSGLEFGYPRDAFRIHSGP